MSWRYVIVVGLAVLADGGSFGVEAEASPFAREEHWAVEQVAGGKVLFQENRIVIEDRGGCTLWWRERLVAPVEIAFTVTPQSNADPELRVSDLNCFWMAQQVNSFAPPFAAMNARSGRFSEYDSLRTYYVGLGGNNNTTVRFRRYDGSGDRPLRPEHDLSDRRYRLQADRPHRIRIVVKGGLVEYWRDGERLFQFHDPQPLTWGWFGFRTVRSRLSIEDFSCQRLAPDSIGGHE